MFEHFETYISTKGSFTKEELQLMRSLSVEKKLRKRQLLLHEGEVCKYKTFVVKGLFRAYCVNADGVQHVMRFAAENHWIVDPESYNKQIPSRYNIEALEDAEVIQWTPEHFEELFTTVPAFRSFSKKLISRAMEASQNRVLMHISYTAEEKYNEFINSFPNVFGRVPLHMVASYLGVSRETLSRVRHAQLKR